MIRKNFFLHLLCVLTLVLFSTSVFANSDVNMTDESAQVQDQSSDDQSAEDQNSVDQSADNDEATKATETVESKPESKCSADLRSDSVTDQVNGAKCAGQNKDSKAIADLLNLLQNQDNPTVATEVFIALAQIGETGENDEVTNAVINLAANESLKPADRYIAIAAMVALRTDSTKQQIIDTLSNAEQSNDTLLSDLAAKLKALLEKG